MIYNVYTICYIIHKCYTPNNHTCKGEEGFILFLWSLHSGEDQDREWGRGKGLEFNFAKNVFIFIFIFIFIERFEI